MFFLLKPFNDATIDGREGRPTRRLNQHSMIICKVKQYTAKYALNQHLSEQQSVHQLTHLLMLNA